MSTQFTKNIVEDESFTLVLNYSGISESTTTPENLTLEIYAYDANATPIFTHTLSTIQARALYQHLNSVSILKDETLVESGTFIEMSSEALYEFFTNISEIEEPLLSVILGKISTTSILHSLGSLDIDNLSASHKQQRYIKELKKLRLILHLEEIGCLMKMVGRISLIMEYNAGQPEKVLQNWLENNLWVFGVEYEKIEGFREISESSEGDLVMRSIDGYLDLIELKKSKYDLLRFDTSHNCYYGSSKLNVVIGQSMHYLKQLTEYSETLSTEFDVKILRPRIKIVAGRSKGFNSVEFNTMRMINSHLIDISVITYDEILKYGEKIISHYR